MRTPCITLSHLKILIEHDDVPGVQTALSYAQRDVINEATFFAYVNNHLACFEALAQAVSLEYSHKLIQLSCEYDDLDYFKILMNLPQDSKTLEHMIAYGAREDFFDGFAWGIETFNTRIDGADIMLEALQSGPRYVDVAYQHFPQSSTYGLKNIHGFRNRMNSSPKNLSVIDASVERLNALITHNALLNTIDATDRQRGRKI